MQRRRRQSIAAFPFVYWLLLFGFCQETAGITTRVNVGRLHPCLAPGDDILTSVRGGASSDSPRKKKKKSRKQNPQRVDEKKAISQAMKEKDAAETLGEAIRNRADILREDSPQLQRINMSISSVGWAMGASDQHSPVEHDEEGGGVQAPAGSVLANYFLKSHGGAHAPQSVCGLLAAVAGLSSFLPMISDSLRLVLVKRSMLFAMTKHVAGLLAATSVAAGAIPEVGLRRTRRWMEKLALDPVSQYVFYSALLLLWLPNQKQQSLIWWSKIPWVLALLIGPILLREVVSTAYVVSDVLVLLSSCGDHPILKIYLKAVQSAVNASMSLLVTPGTWRGADPAERQAILARLTSRVSLALELLVGLLLCADSVWSMTQFVLHSGETRPSMLNVGKQILCTRLYLNFLWVRKRRISQLVATIRGGASQVPSRVMDILLDPIGSMGVVIPKNKETMFTWKDHALLILGLDSDDQT